MVAFISISLHRVLGFEMRNDNYQDEFSFGCDGTEHRLNMPKTWFPTDSLRRLSAAGHLLQ